MSEAVTTLALRAVIISIQFRIRHSYHRHSCQTEHCTPTITIIVTCLQDSGEVQAGQRVAVAVPRQADVIVEPAARVGRLDAQRRRKQLQRPSRDVRPRVLLCTRLLV